MYYKTFLVYVSRIYIYIYIYIYDLLTYIYIYIYILSTIHDISNIPSLLSIDDYDTHSDFSGIGFLNIY